MDDVQKDESIEADHLRIDLYQREWATADFDIFASTEQPLLNDISDLGAHVLLSCPSTQLRRSYRVDSISRDGYVCFTGSIGIPRSAVAGKATIALEVIGEYRGRRRVVGSAVPWTLIIEKSDAPPKPGIPPLKTVWVSFAEADAPAECRRHAVAHAYVDVAASPPILYLNTAIDGLQSLILADRPKQERRRQRDLISTFIARYVASSLFRAGAEQVAADEFGGPADGPTGQVFRDICEAVSAELPDTETVQDLYEWIARLPDGPPDSAVFWADVDLALDRMTSVGTAARTGDSFGYAA